VLDVQGHVYILHEVLLSSVSHMRTFAEIHRPARGF
jgi:hypothetical protein